MPNLTSVFALVAVCCIFISCVPWGFLLLPVDPSYRWCPRLETQGLKSGIRELGRGTHLIDRTRDLRFGNLKMGPETQALSIRGTRNPRPGTLKMYFQKTFLVFSEVWWLWMNSLALCACVYFYLSCYCKYTFNLFLILTSYSFPVVAKTHIQSLTYNCYEIFKFPRKSRKQW